MAAKIATIRLCVIFMQAKPVATFASNLAQLRLFYCVIKMGISCQLVCQAKEVKLSSSQDVVQLFFKLSKQIKKFKVSSDLFDPRMHSKSGHTDVLMSSSSYNPITVKQTPRCRYFPYFSHLPSHIHVRSSRALQADEYACDLYALRAQLCWGPYHVPLCWTFRC